MQALTKYNFSFFFLLLSSFSDANINPNMLVKQANHGDPQAQRQLISHYQKSAQEGDDSAQCYVGLAYKSAVNYSKAIYWLEKSAQQGNRDAQYHLGKIYYYGKGVDKDLDKAQQLWQSSCKGGRIDACYTLK